MSIEISVNDLVDWNFFLALDDDLEKVARFIEPCEANFARYSIELARILMAAGAEADVLLKQICQRARPTKKKMNIGLYFPVVEHAFPFLRTVTVHAPRHALVLSPWRDWEAGSPPFWWTAVNEVKHHRHTSLGSASLKNALNAVAAVYVLNLVWRHDMAKNCQLRLNPKFLKMGAPFTTSRDWHGDDDTWSYSLSDVGAPS